MYFFVLREKKEHLKGIKMKKFTLLAALLLFATIGIYAQNADTTVIVNNHEIKINDSGEKIKIKIYELDKGSRTTNEPIYESSYSRKREDGGRIRRFSYSFSNDEVTTKEDNGTTVVKSTSRWFTKELHQPFPNLYFSHLELTDGSFGSFSNMMHQKQSSFEWGMYSPITIFCTNDEHFGIATAFGFSNSYNFFGQDYVLMMNDDGNSEMQPLSVYTNNEYTSTSKSFLRYWSLRVPLTMQAQFKVNRSYLTFSAGAEVEWRIWVRSFARYGGSKHTISSDLDYNAIGLNALFQVGYNGFILFSRFGLTEMFKSNKLNDVYQMSVGIGINFD